MDANIRRRPPVAARTRRTTLHRTARFKFPSLGIDRRPVPGIEQGTPHSIFVVDELPEKSIAQNDFSKDCLILHVQFHTTF
jgi:hypothetical protein